MTSGADHGEAPLADSVLADVADGRPWAYARPVQLLHSYVEFMLKAANPT